MMVLRGRRVIAIITFVFMPGTNVRPWLILTAHVTQMVYEYLFPKRRDYVTGNECLSLTSYPQVYGKVTPED